MVTDETATAHSSHLPRQLNALVGRATELAQMATMVLSALAAPLPSASENKPSASSASPRQQANAALIESLSERELEILDLIAEGHTNHVIADKLILSPGTVKWYSSEIYGKLGVANRTQAVAEARRLKLLTA